MEYGVFICHSYRHSDIYDELRHRLRRASYFSLRNESIPDDMLVQAESDDHLRGEIRRRIARSDVVLVLTKPVAATSAWLQEEINIAKEFGKPIIAITRRKRDRKSKLVLESATRHVDTWRIDDVIRAIRSEVRSHRGRSSAPPSGPGAKPPTPKDVLMEQFNTLPRGQTEGGRFVPPPERAQWWHRLVAKARTS